MKVMMTIAVAAILTVACNAQPEGMSTVDLKTDKDSASYALGSNIGSSLQQQGADIDPNLLAAGLKDALAGESKMTEEEIRGVLMAFQERSMKAQAEMKAKQGQEAAKKSDEFLKANKTKDGVMTTPSGLQYKVIKEGNGPKPMETDQVKVHYTGTLIDGKKFDSSYDRGEPAVFGLNQVIPGWTEGLSLMSVGSKYMLYLPSALGYGEQGAGGMIGPNEALIFEVELLEIVN
jgi:FKBP-type peptidyl-prolyl cis-trans isomerase